jgi:hypothetical protein
MRKVLIVLAVISVVSLAGAFAGSGMTLPGTASSPTSAAVVHPTVTPMVAQATGRTGSAPTAGPAGRASARVAAPPKSTPVPTATPIAPSALVTTHVPLVLLNPSSARPGSTVGVTGSGFDPGTTLDIYLKHSQNDQGTDLGFVQADKSGSFGGFNVTLPSTFVSGPFIVDAKEHNGGKEAYATGTVAANSPQVTFGTQVGKPGDVVAFSLKGFAPDEAVKVYFNSLSSPIITTVHTDQNGDLRQDNLTVPFGAIGNNSFIFFGQKSQSPVTVSFLMLNLYPTITVNTYATKADSTLSFSGKGFGPDERVLLHLNSVQSPPIAVVQADGQGAFTNGAAFTIPFELKGKNTFIAIGEQSQAPATVSIDVLPYTPLAETSTYGGRPGTTITFYGTGFARDEVVDVYAGGTTQSRGTEVSCFLTNDQGNFGAAGSYTIEPNTQPGNLTFTLIGNESQAPAVVKMQIMPPDANTPPMANVNTPPFHCPYDANPPSRAGLPTPTPVPPPQQATVPS